jgi:hypothetical integral membrane protein (TIGR02206 family)
MENFLASTTERVVPYSLEHLIFLGFAVLVIVLFIINADRLKSNADAIRKGLLVVLIIQQTVLYSWYYIFEGFSISESLPLHICRITNIFILAFLIKPNKKIVPYLFFFSIFGYAAMILPAGVHPFHHIIDVSFMVNHLVMAVIPFVLVKVYGYKPLRNEIINFLVVFNIAWFAMYFLNPLIDGNYFYTVRRPIFASLPIPMYILITNGMMIVVAIIATYIANPKQVKVGGVYDQRNRSERVAFNQ